MHLAPAAAASDTALGGTAPRYLTRTEWEAAQAAHEARADRYLQPHLERRRRGEKHAVEDFLFEYYRLRPGRLRRWHPGAGVRLLDPDEDRHPSWRHYTTADSPVTTPATTLSEATLSEAAPPEAALPAGSSVTVDVPAFLAARGGLVAHVHDLLRATASRAPTFGCFGLHEWAMVYRSADDRRHPAPLRLGPRGTDEVLETMQIRCTHYDAFRFFTPEARPRNESTPTRATQIDLEQPGCLHAGMDVYRFAGELLPAVPSDLVMECFEHAMRARYLDMRASPYDLGHLGLAPIRIETPAGRAEYVAAQRELAAVSATLRERLIAVCARLLALS